MAFELPYNSLLSIWVVPEKVEEAPVHVHAYNSLLSICSVYELQHVINRYVLLTILYWVFGHIIEVEVDFDNGLIYLQFSIEYLRRSTMCGTIANPMLTILYWVFAKRAGYGLVFGGLASTYNSLLSIWCIDGNKLVASGEIDLQFSIEYLPYTPFAIADKLVLILQFSIEYLGTMTALPGSGLPIISYNSLLSIWMLCSLTGYEAWI